MQERSSRAIAARAKSKEEAFRKAGVAVAETTDQIVGIARGDRWLCRSRLTRAGPADRLRDLGACSAACCCGSLTRGSTASLQAAHLRLPRRAPSTTSPGHPVPSAAARARSPTCGRATCDAVRLYPLGPGVIRGHAGRRGRPGGGSVSGRTWTPDSTASQWRAWDRRRVTRGADELGAEGVRPRQLRSAGSGRTTGRCSEPSGSPP